MIVVLIVVVVLVVLKMLHVINLPWLNAVSPAILFATIIMLWLYVSRNPKK